MREYHVNSIWYWWPLVKNVGVPVPRTTLVEYRGHTLEPEPERMKEEEKMSRAKLRTILRGLPINADILLMTTKQGMVYWELKLESETRFIAIITTANRRVIEQIGSEINSEEEETEC